MQCGTGAHRNRECFALLRLSTSPFCTEQAALPRLTAPLRQPPLPPPRRRRRRRAQVFEVQEEFSVGVMGEVGRARAAERVAAGARDLGEKTASTVGKAASAVSHQVRGCYFGG